MYCTLDRSVWKGKTIVANGNKTEANSASPWHLNSQSSSFLGSTGAESATVKVRLDEHGCSVGGQGKAQVFPLQYALCRGKLGKEMGGM